jgi:hypothetical protein
MLLYGNSEVVKVKIDDYIRHLELQRKGLRAKYIEFQRETDRNYNKLGLKKGLDPKFEETAIVRNNIKEINNKLEFLNNLRMELINNEMQNQKNK